LESLGYKKNIELSIHFTTDEVIKKLNKKYRKKNKATDVLSFSPVHSEAVLGVIFLGDIVISIPTAIKNAKAHLHSLKKELIFLTIHGILHLVGFNHEGVSAKKAKQMFDLQNKIVKKIIGEDSKVYGKFE